MPETLERVEHLFHHIQSFGHKTITLLVVPGRNWQSGDLQRLHALIEQGGIVSGHGWMHKVKTIQGFKHRLHSLLISKDVAEHLALKKTEIKELVRNCYQWFHSHGLPNPEIYVPPAWAMGSLNHDDLAQLPFHQYETMNGVYDSTQKHYYRSPMLGFEARDAWRVPFIRLWNWINFNKAKHSGILRIGIHPDDHTLPLAADMDRYLVKIGRAEKYSIISQINA